MSCLQRVLPSLVHPTVQTWLSDYHLSGTEQYILGRRFTRQEILRNATPHIPEQHTDIYSRLYIRLLTLKECPIYRPTKTLDKMQ